MEGKTTEELAKEMEGRVIERVHWGKNPETLGTSLKMWFEGGGSMEFYTTGWMSGFAYEPKEEKGEPT